MDREAWWATIHRVVKSVCAHAHARTHTHTHTHTHLQIWKMRHREVKHLSQR